VLTRQGWLVGIGAAVLVLAGRLLGLPELYALAAVAIALLVACLASVRLARLDLEIGRSVHPTRVQVGTSARVELRLRNRRPLRTPVLQLRDPVTGTRGADLRVPPLRAGETTVAAYRLPTARRGLLRVGPLEVVVADPFGLVRLAMPAAPLTELVVYPRVDQVRPLPYTTGHDPQAGVRRPNSLGRTGEDFYALRPYVVGDDLRRVHWPSTARHDELLVRQNELPWQGRTTVVVDVRRASMSTELLDVAVSAAASIVNTAAARRDLVRLLTTDGVDSDFGPGADHIEAIMEHLAVVPPTSNANLRRVVESLARRSTGGALVVVLAEVPDDDLRAVAALRGRYGSVTIVQIDRSSADASAPEGTPSPLAIGLGGVRVTRTAPFAASWDEHVLRRSVRAAATSGTRS
jgi:uncharacterized protein (DUF58 family)